MANFQDRIIRAARLDAKLYEEVEADREATGQAMAVVVMSGVAAGIGTLGTGGLFGVVGGTLLAIGGWFVWAFLTYFIGTRLFSEPQTKADLGELLRTIGFASAPGLFRVFGFVPGLGPLIFMAAGIWMLVAMVIAVRQALDYTSTSRAAGVCLIGWLTQVLLVILAIKLFGMAQIEAV
jgi:hypothetical protein